MCACRIFSPFIHGSPLFFSLALFFSPVLPSGALAAASATSRWLCDATRRGAVEAVQRHGVRLPARRLGEGWPCVVKRAERRAASRAAGRLSAGFSTGAWLASDGTPHFVKLHPSEDLARWRPQPALPRAKAKGVACGSTHVIVLLDDCSVVILETPAPEHNAEASNACKWRLLRGAYTTPSSSSSPPSAEADASQPHAPHERSVAVAAGAWHSFIVGEKGGLWACGRDVSGQLGIGSDAFIRAGRLEDGLLPEDCHVTEPTRVATHNRALQASGGGHHSLVLTHSGGVLSFGHNGSGQLGLGDQTTRSTPSAVPMPGGEVACAVAAGGEHSLVLTERGEVYGFGSSIYGALGRPAEANVQKLPCRVPLGLHGMSIRMIAAGYDHALALAADGTVLSWGSIGKLAVAGFAFSNCYGGQLARSVKVFDSEYTYTQDQQPVATPGIATNLGACTLVAAGSFCTMGLVRNAAAGDTMRVEKLTHENRGYLDILQDDGAPATGATIAVARSAPPSE